MTSNAQDGVVVQEPPVVVTEMPMETGAVPAQDAGPQQSTVAQLQDNARAAIRSWPPGRRVWDRVAAWMAASRAVRGSASPDSPARGD
jgi:hypothetical protein